VTVFGARFRRATLAAGDTLGRRRPGVELARVDQGDALPTPATPPRRLALPAPDLPLCPRCRTRHEPRPHPGGGRGMAAVYGQQLLPDPDRPPPMGRDPGHTLGLVRDSFNPWRPHPAAVPPPPGPMTRRERITGWWPDEPTT
jgi:hypothetical protein